MTERGAHVKFRAGPKAICTMMAGRCIRISRMIPHTPSRLPAAFCYTERMARDLSSYKILVVDDDADARSFICAVLEDNGATVLEASDGDAALEVARRERPDLITLDITMPGLQNGHFNPGDLESWTIATSGEASVGLRVEATIIPEPTTLLLLTSTALAILRRKKR